MSLTFIAVGRGPGKRARQRDSLERVIAQVFLDWLYCGPFRQHEGELLEARPKAFREGGRYYHVCCL